MNRITGGRVACLLLETAGNGSITPGSVLCGDRRWTDGWTEAVCCEYWGKQRVWVQALLSELLTPLLEACWGLSEWENVGRLLWHSVTAINTFCEWSSTVMANWIRCRVWRSCWRWAGQIKINRLIMRVPCLLYVTSLRGRSLQT